MISQNTKLSRAITVTAGAAGTADINALACDMEGFEGVQAIVQLGALTTAGTLVLKWQQSSDDGGSDAYSDLEGTGITIDVDADDEKVVYMDLYRPRKRYVRLVADRGTQNSVLTAIYQQYGCRNVPVTQGSNVTGEAHVSPAEGTA